MPNWLKKGLGMQSFRDAVHHLSLWRERLRVRQKLENCNSPGQIKDVSINKNRRLQEGGRHGLLKSISINMNTVQHTFINMNTAYRGFTMLTGGDGRKRKWPLKNKSHDRKRKWPFKRSHDRKKTKALWTTDVTKNLVWELLLFVWSKREV